MDEPPDAWLSRTLHLPHLNPLRRVPLYYEITSKPGNIIENIQNTVLEAEACCLQMPRGTACLSPVYPLRDLVLWTQPVISSHSSRSHSSISETLVLTILVLGFSQPLVLLSFEVVYPLNQVPSGAWVAQWLSVCLWLRGDPRVLGPRPTSGSPQAACLHLCLSLSFMNK